MHPYALYMTRYVRREQQQQQQWTHTLFQLVCNTHTVPLICVCISNHATYIATHRFATYEPFELLKVPAVKTVNNNKKIETTSYTTAVSNTENECKTCSNTNVALTTPARWNSCLRLRRYMRVYV